MDRQVESVAVGPYLLEVGGDAGTLVEKGGSDRSAETKALREALEEPEAEERAPAIEAEVDEAGEATTKVEQAISLFKGVSEGHALSPDQLALEVGTLLNCLERLDRKKEYKKALQLARALANLLMLLKRWSALLETLRIGLRAGKELGDPAAIAWAKHELGTLHLAAGDVEGADRCLNQAREIRERIGDRRGLAATERNMQALCDRLRSMLRNEELIRHSPPRTARLLSLAGLFVVLFGGGVAAGVMVGGDSGPEGTAVGITDTQEDEDTSDEIDTGTHPGGDGETDETTRFSLVINITGSGGGSVFAAGSECAKPECRYELAAGTEVQFDYNAGDGSSFERFSGDCSDTSCTLTMNESMAVTATFNKDPEANTTTEDTEEEEEEEEETTPEIIE
jgi:tetratricopeptide (TPR) repeat protein